MTNRFLFSLLLATVLSTLGKNSAFAATLLASQQFQGSASGAATGTIGSGGASPRAGAIPIPTGAAPQPAPQSNPTAAFSGQGGQSAAPAPAASPPPSASPSQAAASAAPRPTSSAAPRTSPAAPTTSSGSASRRSAPSSAARSTASPSPASSLATSDQPTYDAKGVALVTTAPNVWSAEASWGWFNKYYFRGVDVLRAVSPDDGGGVTSSRINLAYSRPNDAFLVGLGYVQAINRQMTRQDASAGTAFSNYYSDRRVRTEELYGLPSEDRYAETNLYLAYSRNILPDVALATVGYNRYHFSNAGFWADDVGGIGASNEAFVRFDFPGVPIVQPSITYVREFEGFIGSYLEARLEADFPLGSIGSTRIGLRPYIAASYDYKYNGVDGGWNAMEYGASVPIQLNDSLTISLNANYVQGLESTATGPRANPGFWGGVVISGTWGSYATGGSVTEDVSSFGKGGKYEILPPKARPWEISVGSGFRRVTSDFQHTAPQGFSGFGGLLNPNSDRGQLGLASIGSGRDYADGSVSPGSPADGTAITAGGRAFALGSSSEQRIFQSFRYAYSDTSELSSVSVQDTDGVMFPYVQLDREIWSSGRSSLRMGFLYSFLNSESDSGYQLGRLDKTFEDKRTHTFVYDNTSFNALPLGNVVVDGGIYGPVSGFALFPGPQEAVLGERTEVVKVGSFLQSRLSVDAHDLSIPFDFQYQLGNRLRLEFSVAPTLSLVNSRLETTVEHRRLLPSDSRGTVTTGPRENEYDLRLQTAAGVVSPGRAVGQESNSASDGDGTPPFDPAVLPGGRSGRVYSRPEAPGELLGIDQFAQSESEALFGVSTGAKLVLDLNDEGTFFIDVWGRYQHIDSTTISNGLGSAEIDLSGWQIGSGIGIRF